MPTISAPAKPFKLTFAHNAIWGIYNGSSLPGGSGLWGVSVHSLGQDEGYRWVVHNLSTSVRQMDLELGYTGLMIRRPFGIAVHNYWLYLSISGGLLLKWKIDASGHVDSGSMVYSVVIYEYYDIKIYENEIYCLDAHTESQAHILRVYDFDFNFVREFPISEITHTASTMAINNGLIYIDDRSGFYTGGRMKIYTTTGDFVETVNLNLGSVNTIN